MAPSFSRRQVSIFVFHKKMWSSGHMPHWLRTQHWSMSIVTTGTVCTHSPLCPSCRIWGDGQCSNCLSHAGMNMFATIHSGAVLPDDWLVVTTSAPPPHPLTTSALPPLPFPPHWLMFNLSRAPDFHARFPCLDLCTCHPFHLDCSFASWANFCLSCRSQGVLLTPSTKVKVLVLISIFFFVI